MKRFTVVVEIWLLAFAACAVLASFTFVHVDLPVAVHFWKARYFVHHLDTAFGASVILTLETTVTLILVVTRVVRGHLSRTGEALAIACLASICSYGINDEVLKAIFGVPNPSDVMGGARHTFHLLMGSPNSSFPSGHMVLAGGFAGVLMRLYRRSIGPLCALLLIGMALLVVGGWHFVSDVITGAFLGVSAGLLAGEVWNVHSELLQGRDREK